MLWGCLGTRGDCFKHPPCRTHLDHGVNPPRSYDWLIVSPPMVLIKRIVFFFNWESFTSRCQLNESARWCGQTQRSSPRQEGRDFKEKVEEESICRAVPFSIRESSKAKLNSLLKLKHREKKNIFSPPSSKAVGTQRAWKERRKE